MESLNLNKDVCRICLDHKVILNWNDEIFEFCGTSYRDCYFKYTQLEENDSDSYPKNLCDICAEELRNAHFLFEKALESFSVLQATFVAKNLETNYYDVEIYNSHSNLQRQINTCNEIASVQPSEMINQADDELLVEQLADVCGNESTIESENIIDNPRGMLISENFKIEPSHFIDIQNIHSSDETLLEPITRSCGELPKSPSSKYRKRRNKLQAVQKKTSKERKLNEIGDKKLPESLDNFNDKNKRKTCESPLESFLEQNVNETCGTNSSSNHAFKTRKKYILICQYCSLKVNGTNQLKLHEATHSENRKRTETCPQCGVKLYTKMSLNEHMKIHKENRQRSHRCEFCEKAFFHKGALNVHRRIHLGQMVKCQLCPKEFFRQIDLDKHLPSHSVSPLQKIVRKKKYVVQCQYCSKSISTDKWKEHNAAHLDQPQMKCKICDKNFYSRSNCTKHLRQSHHKILSEYEEFIHYFVDRNTRITNLRMKQQLRVHQLTE